MAEVISEQSVVVASKDQLSCDLVGETAILNTASGVYYGLDSIGARVWSLLQQPRQVREIRDTVIAEYEVEPGRCASDLLALLEKLKAAGLIEVKDNA